MLIREMQDEVVRLKREHGVCVLAHSYQAREIIEVADIVGDSYQLSVAANKVEENKVVMCGVKFMAETVKILSPKKKVFLANGAAGCPMADKMDMDLLLRIKKTYPEYTIVAYINTTAEIKTISDVCVTSSSALKIVKALPNNFIYFIPDWNLGTYISKKVPSKKIRLVNGACPIHAAIGIRDLIKVKRAHPRAHILVHPECTTRVIARANFVGSTSAIIEHAKSSNADEFIICTDNSVAENLQYECPDKKFYPASLKAVCKNMKITTLTDVLNAVRGTGGMEIKLNPETIAAARRPIDKMIELGG